MKIKGAIAIGLATVLTLTACGGSGAADEPPTNGPEETRGSTSETPGSGGNAEDLVAAAESEGQVTWYTSIPEPVVQAVVDAFEAEYGITVEFVRGLEGPVVQRFSAEREAGDIQADVFTFASPNFFEEAVVDGWLDPLTADEVPAVGDWPTEFLYEDAYSLLSVQPLGIAYNTNLTETPPTGWDDIFTEEFAGGQTIFGDPTVPSYLALMDLLREEIGVEWLENLAAQEFVLVESMVPGTQSVAAGEGSLAIPALASVVAPLQAEGAPLELIFPDLTTGVEQLGGLVADAPHPNAARLFMNYLMSVEGQEVLVAGTAASVLPDVPGGLDLPSDYRNPDVDAALENETAIRNALGL